MPKPRRLLPSEFKAVGCYVFAGGFTLGVKSAGFEVNAHLEGKPAYGAATVRRNMPNVVIHQGFDEWPIDELSETGVDFVFGNPPCAAWSRAGSSNRRGRSWRDSRLVDCTREHFSLLETIRPRAWAWESVQEAWKLGRELVDALANRAADLGYSTTVWLHDAANLGVPQRRRRFFMVCHDVELDFPDRFDEPTTVAEALKAVSGRSSPPLQDFMKRISPRVVSAVRQGENLRTAWERENPESQRTVNARGQVSGRPSYSYVRPRMDRPSPVVRQEMIHPTEHRGMTVDELKVLSGFPLKYDIVGTDPAYLIGRGVCPPVGEHLAKIVMRGLVRSLMVREPTYRVVDQTRDQTVTTVIDRS